MDPVTIGAGVVLVKAGAGLLGAKTARPVVTAFLDKISEATGVVTKPWQTRRDAKAEADAAVIKAKAEAQITLIKAEADQEALTIQERAEVRRATAAIKEQQNLDAIVNDAAANLKDDAQPEKMDEDWLANFIDKARLFSDEEMQRLWSQVLAGEANVPGSFSRRTIGTLANLEKADAELFRRMCSFSLIESDGEHHLLLNGIASLFYTDSFFKDRGLTYSSVLALTEAGLVNFESSGIRLAAQDFVFSYFGRTIKIVFPDGQPEASLNLGEVALTKVGQELARICSPNEDKDFLEHVLARWGLQGHTIEEVLNTKGS